MSDLKRYLEKQSKNPEFAKEYERLRPQYESYRAMIAARLGHNIVPEISEKPKVRQ